MSSCVVHVQSRRLTSGEFVCCACAIELSMFLSFDVLFLGDNLESNLLALIVTAWCVIVLGRVTLTVEIHC